MAAPPPGNDPQSRSFANSATHASAARSRPDVVAVPFAVWRLGHDESDPAADAGTANTFNARLARRLIEVYTRRGDWVVDLAHDDDLHAAAVGAHRSYLAVTGRTRAAAAHPLVYSGPIGMVHLQWPNTGATAWLAVCRQLVASDGCVIAVLAGEPDQQIFRSAAQAAGLVPVQRIVAVHTDEPGDRFSFYSDIADAQPLEERATDVTRIVLRPTEATR